MENGHTQLIDWLSWGRDTRISSNDATKCQRRRQGRDATNEPSSDKPNDKNDAAGAAAQLTVGMSATRRRRAAGGCCADCCTHASSSMTASASPPARANRRPADRPADAWSDSSAGGRRPAAWPASTPSARRHTMSTANPNGPRRRDVGAKDAHGSLYTGGTLGSAISYDKSLAAAADTYFYFYAGSDKNTLSKSNADDKIAPPTNLPTPSRSHLSAIRRRITAGTGYRTYFEHFLSVRLCRNCQTRWSSWLGPAGPTIGEPTPKSSLDGAEGSLWSERTDFSWIPSIVDFSSSSSSNSSSGCPSPSSRSSAASSPSTVSLVSLTIGSAATGERLGSKNLGERKMCSLLDHFYRIPSQDPLRTVDGQQNEQETVQECQPAEMSIGKRRAIFCPILTTNTRGGRRAAGQHCCGCHNFVCTTYPDQLAFVRAADDAAAAYTARIAQLLSAYGYDDGNDDDDEFGEDEDEDENENEKNASVPHITAQSNEHVDPRLPLNASAAGTRVERECLRRYAQQPAFSRPGLSFRLHVYSPHPARDYCRAAGCIFCAFKRDRAPDDEAAMRALRARVADVRCALAASDEQDAIVQSDFTVVDGNYTGVSTTTSVTVAEATKATVPETVTGVTVVDGRKNNFCASSVASALLSIPFAVIEEKISKLLKRFCDDPEEPNADERCNACCTRRASVRAYPCGHQVLCRTCSVTVIKKIFEDKDDVMRCVLCRRQVAVLRHHKSPRHFAKHLIRPLYIAGERRSKHAVSPTPNKAARSSSNATAIPPV